MHYKTHAILSLIFILLLFQTHYFSPIPLIIIFMSSVFIDADHWFIYVLKKKDLSVKNAVSWSLDFQRKRIQMFKRNPKAKFPKFLCIFHTLEFYAILSVLAFFPSPLSPFFLWILTGVSFHVLLDSLSDLFESDYGKHLSIIYYLIKN